MQSDPEAICNPDFVALGLGGTNMMAMLWTVASGRQAVGVELRGDPFLGVHWNIREDLYHQLGLIDRMMLERYGEVRVPRRANGKLFSLADVFYSPTTTGGDIVADMIIDGFDADQHIVGTIRHVEFIDDRFRDGLPNRVITVLPPPVPPRHPDPAKVHHSMVDVIDSPSTFQAEAARVGFGQHEVEVDHRDGRGPVVAQADFLAGLVEVLVGGRLRRRISSAFDDDGQEYWVRQVAIGHENDPQAGWVLVQVPDFK